MQSNLLENVRAGGRHWATQKVIASLRGDPSLGCKQLADDVGLSLSRVARVFKSDTGVSIVQYRNALRFERLLALATGPEARSTPLRDLARNAGFGSAAHFYRLAQRAWGMSPHRYLRGRAAPPDDERRAR